MAQGVRPTETSATLYKDKFSADKSAGQQSVTVKSKDPDLQFVPLLVKHMTLAIYKNKYGGEKANKKDDVQHGKAPPMAKNFKEAFTIARGMLADYRHLTPGSRHGPIGKINLTGSGRVLESNHRREAGGGKKTKEFDLLYEKYLAEKPKAPQEKRGGA